MSIIIPFKRFGSTEQETKRSRTTILANTNKSGWSDIAAINGWMVLNIVSNVDVLIVSIFAQFVLPANMNIVCHECE